MKAVGILFSLCLDELLVRVQAGKYYDHTYVYRQAVMLAFLCSGSKELDAGEIIGYSTFSLGWRGRSAMPRRARKQVLIQYDRFLNEGALEL